MGARFAQSARKHRIGKGSARYVIATTSPFVVPATELRDEQRIWIGDDERGRELEIVAVVLGAELLVIHVMPTHYRGRQA